MLSGHINLGISIFSTIQALYLPGILHFPILFRFVFSSFPISFVCSLSFRLQLYTFPRYLIGLSCNAVIALPFILISLFSSFPFIITNDLHFSGLTLSPAVLRFLTNLFTKLLVWGRVSVVVVMSSINNLAFSCRCPVFNFGPLVLFFTDNTSQVIASEKRTTLSVQPVIMPFSTLCQFVTKSLVVNLILTSL